MQIHDLNNYNGDLGSNAYLAVDDGNDTGKVTVTKLLADTNRDISDMESELNARIDNIIAGGTAPSAAEVTDARLGATSLGAKTYPSLGAAIRGQFTDITGELTLIEGLDVVVEDGSGNLFDRMAVSSSTVTSGELVDGVVTTSSVYAVTPFLEIESNETYTMALVPAFGATNKPWYQASQGISFFDADKNYLGYSSDNTFKTPFGTKYYRFNIGVNAGILPDSVIRNRCMLVRGDSIPTEYIAGYTPDVLLSDRIDAITAIEDTVDNDFSTYETAPGTFVDNYYYGISNGTYNAHNGFCYMTSDVTPGDKMKITAFGTSTAPAVIFFSGEPSVPNTVGSLLSDGAAHQDYTFVVPAGATKAIFQTYKQGAALEVYRLTPMSAADYKKRISYTLDGDTITAVCDYTNSKKISTKFGKRGPNNLPDFGIITIGGVTVNSSSTDWHSPFMVRAINNIDGDDLTHDTFTGGNHNYNNTGDMDSTATARNLSLEYYADGKLLSDGDQGNCDRLDIYWTNRVQGTNTKKSDGTGREILEERHHMTYDGSEWKSYAEIVPLEAVRMVKYFGFQCTLGQFPTCVFIGGTNRQPFNYSGEFHSSGNDDTNMVACYSSDNRLEMEVNRVLDLGRGALYTGTESFFTQTYGKAYAYLIEAQNLDANAVYAAEGYWRFMPNYID